jgi:tetratricopeptide (TPR) repeat protein
MRIASPPSVVAGGILAGLFVVRALTGAPAAWADRRGRVLEGAERYAEAGPLIDRGALGANRIGGSWRAGRTRVECWDTLPESDRAGRLGREALREAAERFLDARVGSPASAWFTATLGDVYARRETAARSQRITDLSALSGGPWSMLGDDGRIAIGLTRQAIAREPNSFNLRDQLVLLLEASGLHDDALTAMAESSRILPDFLAHPAFSFEELPRDLIETFWQTARTLAPEDLPLLARQLWLVSSAKIGRRLGHLDEAESDLRAALALPGTPLARAEEEYFLALVLIDRDRFDEAEPLLQRAGSEPGFAPAIAETRARAAVKQERWPEALEQLRELRRLRPREVWILLEFSHVAQKTGRWDQAEEAIRWAKLVHPEDPAPYGAMVELFLAQGEKVRARGALDEYVRSFGRTAAAAGLERALDAPLDRGGP